MRDDRNILIEEIDFSEALRYLLYKNSIPDKKTEELLPTQYFVD